MAKYTVFVRNWWKRNSSWPNGLEPDAGARKVTIRKGLSLEEARQLCKTINDELAYLNPKNKLGKKAEFTSEGM